MSKLDSANTIGLPSRRLFLTRATAGLAGGLVAAAALAAPALAELRTVPLGASGVEAIASRAVHKLRGHRDSRRPRGR